MAQHRSLPARAVLGALGVVVVTLSALSAAPHPPASAQSSDQAAGGRRIASTGEHHAGIAPELAGVAVTSPGVTRASSWVFQVEDGIGAAAADQLAASQRWDELVAAHAEISQRRISHIGQEREAAERLVANQAEAARLAVDIEDAQSLLNEIAAASYLGAGLPAENPLVSLSVPEGSRRVTYGENLFEQALARKSELIEAREAAIARSVVAATDREIARAAIAADDAALAANQAAAEAAVAAREEAAARQAQLEAELEEARRFLAEQRRAAIVVGLDFPLVVLDAFWKAAATEASWRPGCNLHWSLLAGISRVESRHGTFGSATVAPSGDVQPRIIGPALDGEEYALITDTDGGAYDRDTTYDRAVGPMQFIPGSWAVYGVDGDRDGDRDPNNYYDAAMGAAEHLCRAGWNVATEGGHRGAVLSYNQSEEYLATVTWYRDYYRGRLAGQGL